MTANSRTEARICELEDRTTDATQSNRKQTAGKRKRKRTRLGDLHDCTEI